MRRNTTPHLPLETSWHKLADHAGQTLAEYAMIVSVIAVALVLAALLVFRDGVVDAFGEARGCITGACFDENPPHCNDGNGNDGNQVPCT